jgi:SAM-dependent methyltransferase
MTGGRLLEVGCAYGYFLEEAAPFFRHRTGTDYSREALRLAAGRAEELVLGGPADLPAEERYETAACIHVVEHVYAPVPWLGEIRRRLVPGGALVLATPDAGGFWRPLMGRRWPFHKPPEHVTFFARATLKALLERAGFVDVRPLAYPSIFPLGLAGEKLGLRLPASLRRLAVRMPGATVCLAARRPAAPP